METMTCKDVKRHMARVKALECMDYLVTALNHESCDEFWCMHGLPDDWDEDDLHAIAEDDEQFGWMCKAFLNVMGSDEAYDGGFDL